jgi:dipeptidyl aminopeptidase/acylaminoacyl peptidase
MPSPIGPDYHIHLKLPGDPALTPDGSKLAFTLRWFDPDTLKPRSEIFVTDLGDGASGPPVLRQAREERGAEAAPVQGVQVRQITHESDSELPAWSPDGRLIAFLRPDDRGRRQLWIMGASGGEANQVTDEPVGADALAWSPDGTRIAYRADVDVAARAGAASQAAPEGLLRPTIARRIRYREDGAGWRGDRFRHIFVADLRTRTIQQVTFGEGNDGAPVWSPDGTRLACISDANPFREITSRTDVYVVPAAGGEPDRRSGGLYMAGSIAWSPDGERLAVTGAERAEEVGGHGLICQNWVYVLERGSYPARLTDDTIRPLATAAGFPTSPDYPPLRWTPDGRVVFLADARGQSYVCDALVNGEGMTKLTPGGCEITAWAVDAEARRAVIAAATPSSPGELYLVDLRTGEQGRLTSFNDSYLAGHPPAKLEKFVIKQEGLDIECRLWLPPDFDPARRYPLLLDIHGGPHSVFYDAFYPIHQLGATNGYVVLAPNPRGSSSYGLSFATAVHGDWGGGDYMDIMAALTEAVKRPYVDERRVVVHGSSYGGYMSSWAVGHTDRFRAAVIAAPVTYLPSFYGTSDIGVSFGEVQFGGRRTDEYAWYIRHSPLTYAGNVDTPVLLLHGEDDFRVPIEQSEQYFISLLRAGKTVEFVRLPKTSHGIFRAKHAEIRREYFSRMLAWFDMWLSQPQTQRVSPWSDGRAR